MKSRSEMSNSKPRGLCTASTSWTSAALLPSLSVCTGRAPGAWEGLSLQFQLSAKSEWNNLNEGERSLLPFQCSPYQVQATHKRQLSNSNNPGTAPILQGTNGEEELEGWKRNCVSVGKRQIEAQKTWARRKKVGTRWRASRLLGRETRVKSRRRKTKRCWRTTPS